MTTAAAATDPASTEPRLRGRTYAIPFEDVWQAALRLAGGDMPRWRIVSADDQEGVIVADARTRLWRAVHRATIRIALDEDAQTRVDLAVEGQGRRADFGFGVREIDRFLRRLDRAAVGGTLRAPRASRLGSGGA